MNGPTCSSNPTQMVLIVCASSFSHFSGHLRLVDIPVAKKIGIYRQHAVHTNIPMLCD
jgi:hypothetical protein